MERANTITAWVVAIIAAILSLSVAWDWVRSYQLGQIAQRIVRWESTNNEGVRLFHTRAYYVASSRGAIRVRYGATVWSFQNGFRSRPQTAPATRPAPFSGELRPVTRPAPFSGDVGSTTRPAPFAGEVGPATRPVVRRQRYRLPMANGWFRDIPVTYSFGRDQTARERLLGFECASYDWGRTDLHADGWLLGFPHWSLILLLALYPCCKVIALWRKRRQASKPPPRPA